MTQRILRTYARLATFAVAARVAMAADAKCYYPNGVEATQEKPCSTADGGVACCPSEWTCLDNGLCRYEKTDLWGTYSCTDQSWKSSGCPSNICTYDMKRPGGESIKQCSSHDNQWCCNADDQNVHCCDEWPSARPFYDLQQGQVYATIGGDIATTAPSLASITMLASGSASAAGSSATSPPQSSSPSESSPSGSSQGSSAPASTKTPDPVTSLKTSVTSGTAGIQTVVITSVIQPAQTSGPTPSLPSSSHSKLGVIVGCAVGIPLALALIGILIWLLRKRRQQKANPYKEESAAFNNSPTLNGSSEFAGGAGAKLGKKSAYGHTAEPTTPAVAELPGQSVGPERPISTIKGKAELGSGAGFVPGVVPHNPNLVGVGGGTATGHTPASSWGSAPPGYSPGMNQQSFQDPHKGAVEADSTAIPGHSSGAPTTEGGRYIPYRPPPSHQAHGGQLPDVQEVSEMSAVKTPPA